MQVEQQMFKNNGLVTSDKISRNSTRIQQKFNYERHTENYIAKHHYLLQ